MVLNCKTHKTIKPKIKPQNAEPIPKNCTPEALHKKVIRAASRVFKSENACVMLWLIVPKRAIPAKVTIAEGGNYLDFGIIKASNIKGIIMLDDKDIADKVGARGNS